MSGAEEYVSNLLNKYPPGSYFFRDMWADEIAERYFKMDKERFLAMLRHDYTVALLRRDKDGLTRAREAYRQLASYFDWGEAPWSGIDKAVGEEINLKNAEEDVKKWAEEAAKTLFEVYRDEMAVEGWRTNPNERVWDGLQRGLLSDVNSDRGKAFRIEWERWFELEMRLKKMLWSEELRTGDRVALWFTKKLLWRARIYQHGNVGKWERLWPMKILTWIIEGKYDYWIDLSLLYIDASVMEVIDIIRLNIPGPYLVEDLIAMALMALNKVDPRGRSLRDIERFVEEFSRKTEDEELLEHYRAAKYGGRDFKVYEYAFLGADKIPEDQKKIIEEMRKASTAFFSDVMNYIDEALGGIEEF